LLPDGAQVAVWVGVPEDGYVAKRERDTVVLELRLGASVAASVVTVLDVEQDSEARALAHEVVAGLADGTLEPTAAALEPLADRLR
ncbi:MAG: hypothetical protein ACR2MU_03950, partial [Gaiellaceae bacterium]